MAEIRARASRDEVAEAVRQIRAYHRRGRESLESLPDRGGYHKGAIMVQAERLRRREPTSHWSDTKLRKARKFADPEGGYSQERLDELCRLVRAHRPHFGVAHVGVLVTVPWPERAELQRLCIEGDWGKAELEAEIKQRFGPRRQGGRRRHVAADPAHALVQLDEMADSWLRWHGVAAEEGPGNGPKKPVLDALPDAVRKRVLHVSQSLRRLRQDVAAALEQARAGRRPGRE